MNPDTPSTAPPGASTGPTGIAGPELRGMGNPVPPKRDRILKLAEELAHRLRRRIQTYRRVRTHGPEQVLAEWVNERDIDLRIKSGDPVAVVDALADAADGIDDARRNLEIEMGIDTGDVRGEAG